MKEKWQNWSTRRKAIIAGSFVAFILLIIFIAQNTQAATINFLGGTGQISVAPLMFICALAGGVILGIWLVPRYMKHESIIHKRENELEKANQALLQAYERVKELEILERAFSTSNTPVPGSRISKNTEYGRNSSDHKPTNGQNQRDITSEKWVDTSKFKRTLGTVMPKELTDSLSSGTTNGSSQASQPSDESGAKKEVSDKDMLSKVVKPTVENPAGLPRERIGKSRTYKRADASNGAAEEDSVHKDGFFRKLFS